MSTWSHSQHIEQRQMDGLQSLDTDYNYESCPYDIIIDAIYTRGYNDAYSDIYNPYKRDDYRRAWQRGHDARMTPRKQIDSRE